MPEDVIETALEESTVDWSMITLRVLKKKFPYYGEKQTQKSRQKIWQYMLSHGFYPEDFADLIGFTPDEDF